MISTNISGTSSLFIKYKKTHLKYTQGVKINKRNVLYYNWENVFKIHCLMKQLYINLLIDILMKYVLKPSAGRDTWNTSSLVAREPFLSGIRLVAESTGTIFQ